MLARTLALVQSAWGQFDAGRRPRDSRWVKKLGVEPLEDRRLLATADLGAIAGVVFYDVTGNGIDPGEELAGVSVRLYKDDGDGRFEPGTGDALMDTDVTGAGGAYRFDRLAAGTYLVQQPSQLAGGKQLDEIVGAPLVISAADAAGVAGLTIDSFDSTPQSVTAPSAGVNRVSNAVAVQPGEAIGGERDFLALVQTGTGEISLKSLAFGIPVLQFDSTSGVAGTRIVSWDGVDGDGATLNETGLGSVDLTENGNNAGFKLVIGADQNNGVVEIRIYTDATHWSRTTATIPNTGGLANQNVFIDFSSLQAGAGAAGPADLADVGAVQMEIINSALSVDGQLDLIGTYGHTVRTQDFANTRIIDLRLDKTVDDSTPNLGGNVTFTVTVTNDGPDGATGVAVSDTLPAGLSFVSAFPQGAYDNVSGTWTIGALNVGQWATLQLTATVDTLGTKINTAQVSHADQFDQDSTPGNNIPWEDDQDSVPVTPELIDLSLTKTVNNATPDIGDNVTFTVTVRNDGPNTATHVTVGDTLPAGLSYVSATPVGSYNAGSGQWTVGTLGVNAAATLQITARVDAGGTRTNTAQVTAADQFDPDSTPNNSIPWEDDQDLASVTPRSAVAGIVYVDEDNDGVRDTWEAGIGGVALHLTGNDENGNAIFRSTTTASGGAYRFESLPPSNATGYSIIETQPPDYLDAKETVGSLGGGVAVPSSIDRIERIVVGSGVQGAGYDFGEVRPAAISGFVYHDVNKDGAKQTGEAGIAGVALMLSGRDDLGNTVTRTTTTDWNGFYRFANLRPSDGAGYQIVETQPGGYRDGQESPGTYNGLGLQAFALVPNPVPQVLDDAFAALVLDGGMEGINFNFGEIVNVFSKRSFLASW